ncbi:hypothetical protein NFI96_009643, partial [Prochilodus magdalenae]
VQAQYSVTLSSQSLCAVTGSTIKISCRFTPPDSSRVREREWYQLQSSGEERVLSTDPQYSARVSVSTEQNNCELTVRDVRVRDSGVYNFRFRTWSSDWISASSGVNLTVIEFQVKVDCKTAGQRKVKVTCSSTCKPREDLSYRWYRNDRYKADTETPSIVLDSTSSSDQGWYYCGLYINSKLHHSPPVYLKVIVSDTRSGGKNLHCRSTCTLPNNPTYIWYKNGQPVSDQYSNELYLYDRTGDAGSYSCAVRGHEELRSPAVCALDCWSVSYSTQTICALIGSSVDIHSYYTFPDQLPDPQPAWYIRLLSQDKELSPADGRVEFFRERAHMNTLRLKHLTENDSAEYLLRFKDPYWTHTHSSAGVSLSVTGLQVRVDPAAVTVLEEQTVTLTCSSTCTLPNNPTYVWYKNGQPVTLCKSASCSVAVDSGAVNYSCAVEGHEGLRSPPVYSPRNTRAVIVSSGETVEGDSVTLSCSSDANPPALIYSWYKQRAAANTPMTTDQNYTITNASSQHSGFYYCTAHNQHHNSTPVHLVVLSAEGPEESSVLKLITVGVGVFLALMLVTAALCVWRVKGHSSAEESGQRDTAAVYGNISMTSDHTRREVSDDQDDIHYSSIHFRPSHSQEGSPFLTAKLPLDSTLQDVQYAAVNFRRHTAAPQATDNGFVEDYRVPDFDYNPPNTGPVVVNYSHDEPPAANRTPDNNFGNDTNSAGATDCHDDQPTPYRPSDKAWLDQLCEDFTSADMTFRRVLPLSSEPSTGSVSKLQIDPPSMDDDETLMEAPKCAPTEDVDGQ